LCCIFVKGLIFNKIIMQLNNKPFILQQNILQFIILLIYATLMVVIVFTDTFEMLFVSKNMVTLAVVLSLVYLAFLMYNYLIDYNYLSFSDDENKYIFHFISSRPMNKKPKAIEVLKNKFEGYKIERTLFGRKTEIIISVKTQHGVAKYPPINISGLSKTQIILLTKSLKA